MQTLIAINNGEQSKSFRDKVAKTMQYLSKMLAELSKNDEHKKSWTLLASHISIARRIYRWGQVSGSIELIIELLNNKLVTPAEFLKRAILYLASFLSQSFDMICLIHMVRFKKEAVENAGYWSQFFYFVVCCIEFMDSFVPLMDGIKELIRLSRKSGAEVEMERKKQYARIITATLNSIRRTGDGVVAIRDVLPDVFGPYPFSVAASGFASGVASIYQSIPSLYQMHK